VLCAEGACHNKQILTEGNEGNEGFDKLISPDETLCSLGYLLFKTPLLQRRCNPSSLRPAKEHT
jgi:hypothetical protein